MSGTDLRVRHRSTRWSHPLRSRPMPWMSWRLVSQLRPEIEIEIKRPKPAFSVHIVPEVQRIAFDSGWFVNPNPKSNIASAGVRSARESVPQQHWYQARQTNILPSSTKNSTKQCKRHSNKQYKPTVPRGTNEQYHRHGVQASGVAVRSF